MKTNKLTVIALILWLVTIVIFGWFFVRGNTVTGTDGRTAIVLQAAERDLVLSEMRGLLVATQGILEGVNQGNAMHISNSSRAAGMAAAVDVNPALMAKLPLAFKQLGMSVHQDMDDIAEAADAGTASGEILVRVASTMNKCIACHSSWQIKAAETQR